MAAVNSFGGVKIVAKRTGPGRPKMSPENVKLTISGRVSPVVAAWYRQIAQERRLSLGGIFTLLYEAREQLEAAGDKKKLPHFSAQTQHININGNGVGYSGSAVNQDNFVQHFSGKPTGTED